MSDEKPVNINKRNACCMTSDASLLCIVHYERCKDRDVRPLSDSQFETVHDAIRVRQSQQDDCHRLDSICVGIPCQHDASHHGPPMVL